VPRRDESGVVTVQMLAVWPVFTLAVMLPLRGGLSGWVSLAARHAANAAADEAASYGGSDQAAISAAQVRLGELAPPGLVSGSPEVTITRTASTVKVTVSTHLRYTFFVGRFKTASATEVESIQRFVSPDGQ
jgi:Flp pilus assembly protein TadG